MSLPAADIIPSQTSPAPYFFVGDAAFPLKTYLLRPYPGTYLPDNKRIFNYRLSRARRVIENTFGILDTKFRIFQNLIIANPEKVAKVTQVACVLDNYLKISEMHCPPSARHYCPPGYVDHEDRYVNIIPGDWRTEDNNPLHSVGQVSAIGMQGQQKSCMITEWTISILLMVHYLGSKITFIQLE